MAVAEKGRGVATGIGALSVAMWHGCPARVESAVYLLSSAFGLKNFQQIG